jgi:hypothetical protein
MPKVVTLFIPLENFLRLNYCMCKVSYDEYILVQFYHSIFTEISVFVADSNVWFATSIRYLIC